MEDFKVLDSRDDHQADEADTKCLTERMDSLDGVEYSDHSGHFGNQVFFRLDIEHDNEATHSKIYALIAEHVALCKKYDTELPHERPA